MIPHLEQYYGTFFPKGGMHSITQSIYQLAIDLGVEFNFNSMLRIQKERINDADLPSENEYFNSFGLTYKKLLKAKKDVKAIRSFGTFIISLGILLGNK